MLYMFMYILYFKTIKYIWVTFILFLDIYILSQLSILMFKIIFIFKFCFFIIKSVICFYAYLLLKMLNLYVNITYLHTFWKHNIHLRNFCFIFRYHLYFVLCTKQSFRYHFHVHNSFKIVSLENLMYILGIVGLCVVLQVLVPVSVLVAWKVSSSSTRTQRLRCPRVWRTCIRWRNSWSRRWKATNTNPTATIRATSSLSCPSTPSESGSLPLISF